jgi:hypothetical protein
MKSEELRFLGILPERLVADRPGGIDNEMFACEKVLCPLF